MKYSDTDESKSVVSKIFFWKNFEWLNWFVHLSLCNSTVAAHSLSRISDNCFQHVKKINDFVCFARRNHEIQNLFCNNSVNQFLRSKIIFGSHTWNIFHNIFLVSENMSDRKMCWFTLPLKIKIYIGYWPISWQI